MPVFGGQLGVAEKGMKSRPNRIDDEEAKATQTSDTSKQDTKKEEKPAPRPPMSKKWYE